MRSIAATAFCFAIAAPTLSAATFEVVARRLPTPSGAFWPYTVAAADLLPGAGDDVFVLAGSAIDESAWPAQVQEHYGVIYEISSDRTRVRPRELWMGEIGDAISMASRRKTDGAEFAFALLDGRVARYDARSRSRLGDFAALTLPIERYPRLQFIDSSVDNDADLLIGTEDGLVRRSSADGSLQWAQPSAVDFAQVDLDVDGRPEVVVPERGEVLDVGTGSLRWSFAARPGAISVGRFGDAGEPGFVVSTGPIVTILELFVGSQPTPRWTLDPSPGAIFVRDFNGDGTDEIVVRAAGSGDAPILDASTGTAVGSFAPLSDEYFLFARTGDDHVPTIVRADGYHSVAGFDFDGTRRFAIGDSNEPYRAVTHAPIGDGGADVVIAATGGPTAGVDVIDPRGRIISSHPGSDLSMPHALLTMGLVQASGDASPALVLVGGSNGMSSGVVRMVDLDSWTLRPVSLMAFAFNHMVFARRGGEVVPVAVSADDSPTGLRVRVRSPIDLSLTTTLDLPRQLISGFNVPMRAYAMNLDADADDELLITQSDSMQAFDLSTRQLLWRRDGNARIAASLALLDGTPVIGVLSSEGALSIVSTTGQLVQQPIALPISPAALQPVRGKPGWAVVCGQRDVWLVDLTEGTKLVSPSLGQHSCSTGSVEALADGPEHIRVVAGGIYGAIMDADLGAIFRDDFDVATPRCLNCD